MIFFENIIYAICIKNIMKNGTCVNFANENKTALNNVYIKKSKRKKVFGTDIFAQAAKPHIQSECTDKCFCDNEGLRGRGLLYYKKWWEKNVVNIFVGGTAIIGTPIFVNQNTLRVVNDSHSYFIPLEKIDYIRTDDGLQF